MVLGRPALFDRALVDLKRKRLDQMPYTVRSEQLAVLAILSSFSSCLSCDLLLIIF
jgi:hypothetical protein